MHINARYIFGMVTAMLLTLIGTSCGDEPTGTASGGQVTMTFSASLAPSNSRDLGDGSSATTLHYGLYLGDRLLFSGDTILVDGRTSLDFTLNRGEKYDLLLWADVGDGSPYAIDLANRSVSVDYDQLEVNCDHGDAFAAYTSFVAGMESASRANTLDVSLTRPLAQINIGTSDLDGVSEDFISNAQIVTTIHGAPTTINLADGSVDNPVDRQFEVQGVLSGEDYPVGGHDHVFMCYVPAAEGSAVTLSMTINGKSVLDGINVATDGNKRANIYGTLLTPFRVWDGVTLTAPEVDDFGNYIIDNAAKLAYVCVNGNKSGAQYVITADLDLGGNMLTSSQTNFSNLKIEGNSHKISNYSTPNIEGGTTALFPTVVGATINNLTIDNATIGYNGNQNANYDQYAGALLGVAYGTIRVNGVKVINSTVYGANKIGMVIGFSTESDTFLENCCVDNCFVRANGILWSGHAGGLIGYLSGITSTITNCHVSNTEVNCNSVYILQEQRASSVFIGQVHGNSGQTVAIDGCSAQGTLTSSYNRNDFVGYDREGLATITIDGKAIEWWSGYKYWGIRFYDRSNYAVDTTKK